MAHDLTGPFATIKGLIDLTLLKHSKTDDKIIRTGIKVCLAKCQKIFEEDELKKPKLNNPILTNHEKILLKEQKQIHLFDLNNIIYIIGSGNYSTLHLAEDNMTYTFCIIIGELEKQLITNGFFRINKNIVINLKYLISYTFRINHYAIMKTGKELEISRRRVPYLKKFLAEKFS